MKLSDGVRRPSIARATLAGVRRRGRRCRARACRAVRPVAELSAEASQCADGGRHPGIGAGSSWRLQAGAAAERISLLDIVLAVEGPQPAFRCGEIRQHGPVKLERVRLCETVRHQCRHAAGPKRPIAPHSPTRRLSDIVAEFHDRSRSALGRRRLRFRRAPSAAAEIHFNQQEVKGKTDETQAEFLRSGARTDEGGVALNKAVDECGLEKSLLHLIKLRASQINGCSFCVEMHSREARARRRDRAAALSGLGVEGIAAVFRARARRLRLGRGGDEDRRMPAFRTNSTRRRSSSSRRRNWSS